MSESDVAAKSFRIYFSIEVFIHMRKKLPNAIFATTTRKESRILYYNTLQMEARTGVVTKTYLHVLDKQSLQELWYLLGDGIGLGLSTGWPTKRCKMKYCTINGKLNTVEVEDLIPPKVRADPFMSSRRYGIDFIYSEETRQLTCNLHFTSLPVSTADIAKS